MALQDALASRAGAQLPLAVWRSDVSGHGEAEPLYPWFFEAIGLERVPNAESPRKRAGRGRGQVSRRAGPNRRPGKGERYET